MIRRPVTDESDNNMEKKLVGCLWHYSNTSLRCRPTEGNHEDSLPPKSVWNVKLCHSSVRFGTAAHWLNTMTAGVQWVRLI